MGERLLRENSNHESPEDVKTKFEIAVQSIASDKHFGINEDAHFADAEKGIFGVFDGVGGAAAGDEASRFASESVQRSLRGVRENATLEEATEAVRHALLEANRVVSEQRKIKRNDMCSTASVGIIWIGPDGEKKAVIGNAGDSRVYLIRNEELLQITVDDNIARQNAKSEQHARELQTKLNNIVDTAQLSAEERALFFRRNIITKVVGMEGMQPDVHVVNLEPADKLIVCSDGVSDNLTDTEIETILNENADTQTATEKLVEAAQARARSYHPRAKHDDITGMIIEMSGKAKQRVVLPFT